MRFRGCVIRRIWMKIARKARICGESAQLGRPTFLICKSKSITHDKHYLSMVRAFTIDHTMWRTVTKI